MAEPRGLGRFLPLWASACELEEFLVSRQLEAPGASTMLEHLNGRPRRCPCPSQRSMSVVVERGELRYIIVPKVDMTNAGSTFR